MDHEPKTQTTSPPGPTHTCIHTYIHIHTHTHTYIHTHPISSDTEAVVRLLLLGGTPPTPLPSPSPPLPAERFRVPEENKRVTLGRDYFLSHTVSKGGYTTYCTYVIVIPCVQRLHQFYQLEPRVELHILYIPELTLGTNRSLVSFTSLVISSDNVNRGLVLLLLLCLIYKPGHN